MAEEQDGVTLSDAADALGIGREALLSILSPMLHISFRAQTNDEMIDTTYAFELDEDTDRLSVDQAHWLRDMRSTSSEPRDCTAARAGRARREGRVVATRSGARRRARQARGVERRPRRLHPGAAVPRGRPRLRRGGDTAPLHLREVRIHRGERPRSSSPTRCFASSARGTCGQGARRATTIKYFRVDRMLDAEMTKLPRFHPPSRRRRARPDADRPPSATRDRASAGAAPQPPDRRLQHRRAPEVDDGTRRGPGRGAR